jgi:hypothetical protein
MFFSTGLSSSGHHEAKASTTGQMSSALGYRGWMMKVGTDGRLSPFAAGFRSPAGIGMNASDEIFITDNQGDWVASSYLSHVEAGDFLGHPAALWDREEYGITPRTLDYKNVDMRVAKVPELNEEEFRTLRKRPAAWLIHGDLTNSPGNPSFCPPKGFGPFEGQAFIAGDPMIEVITFDKENSPFEMQRIELTKSGFNIHFTQPIAADEIVRDQISIKRFHYLYWAEYGSNRQDNQTVAVQSLHVSPDRRVLSIGIPIVRDKVYEIDLGQIQSASGRELENNFAYYTLNELLK